MTADALDTRLVAIERQLAELLERGGVPQRYMTVGQAATYTGLSPKSLRRAIETGRLAVCHPNGRLLLDRLAVDAWLSGPGGRRRR